MVSFITSICILESKSFYSVYIYIFFISILLMWSEKKKQRKGDQGWLGEGIYTSS